MSEPEKFEASESLAVYVERVWGDADHLPFIVAHTERLEDGVEKAEQRIRELEGALGFVRARARTRSTPEWNEVERVADKALAREDT